MTRELYSPLDTTWATKKGQTRRPGEPFDGHELQVIRETVQDRIDRGPYAPDEEEFVAWLRLIVRMAVHLAANDTTIRRLKGRIAEEQRAGDAWMRLAGEMQQGRQP